ncbi:hypothetical protein B0T21DRAFT_134292 [Apiosordaria backusii]|uniref:Uncharacterized protein n=1 Tax=Apiosordaria backusii TaxID=314023 RepID=A0AA39ZP94_9PEZI|nr:hypothetical protein B0T21DRAFT_134292 [Apiosordaria backusii]
MVQISAATNKKPASYSKMTTDPQNEPPKTHGTGSSDISDLFFDWCFGEVYRLTLPYHQLIPVPVKQFFGGSVLNGGLINPTYLAFSDPLYRIQSQTFHIPDWFGPISNTPEKRARQGLVISIVLCIGVLLSSLALPSAIRWINKSHQPSNKADTVNSRHLNEDLLGIVLGTHFLVGFPLSAFLLTFWYSREEAGVSWYDEKTGHWFLKAHQD